ncbi:TPA: hypothetical protein ACWSSS_005349, partial [Klebsiella pneumoniae]
FDVFAGKKSAQIREILISESAWEEMTCLFAPSLNNLFYDISLWSDRHNPVAAENAPAPALFRAVVAETSVRRLPPSHDAARLSCPLKRCNSFR